MGRMFRMYGKMKGIYMDLVGKPGGKRPLGIHSCRWEDNIKMDLKKWDREHGQE